VSYRPTTDPLLDGSASRAVARTIASRARTIGDLPVRRLLPTSTQRLVGPFIYADHMGPHAVAPGRGVDVPQHPHIHLATVTYLFEGQLVHRDSTGATETIAPGEVNWMTAGRGVVHSERLPPGQAERIHGMQFWLALPRRDEETDPFFVHHPADAFPGLEDDGVRLRVLLGRMGSRASPVRTHSPTLYAEARLAAGARLRVPAAYEELGVYVVDGSVSCGGATAAAGTMCVLAQGAGPEVVALEDAHVVLLGGDRLDGERHIWWNFVSSRPERIEEAARSWRAGGFGRIPGDVPDSLRMPPMVFPWRRQPVA
jgi:redox-sensitive bicupin YhaK (pirin superfamily)